MSGRKSRNKGRRGELEFLSILQGMGLDVERVPDSGAIGFHGYRGDLVIKFPHSHIQVEVKKFRTPPSLSRIREHMHTCHIWAGKQDAKPWLIVMDEKGLWDLLSNVGEGK